MDPLVIIQEDIPGIPTNEFPANAPLHYIVYCVSILRATEVPPAAGAERYGEECRQAM